MAKLVLSMLAFGLLASCLSAQEDTTDSPEVKFESVVSAQSILNREIIDHDGVKVGTVDDIVVDVHNGRVAFATVRSSRREKLDSDLLIILPSLIHEWEVHQPLKLAVQFKDLQHCPATMAAKPLTASGEKELAAIYEHYHVDHYWKSDEGRDTPPSLMTVDDLDGRIVRTSDRVKFGRVEEILLAPRNNWSIAFLAVSEFKDRKTDTDRIAVPLAAFARMPSSTTWLLDVPAEAKLLAETFTAGNWPHEIDRGWIEFTHVKYGASAVGGIQSLDGKETPAKSIDQ